MNNDTVVLTLFPTCQAVSTNSVKLFGPIGKSEEDEEDGEEEGEEEEESERGNGS